MIQPLHGARSVWILDYVDIENPVYVPAVRQYYLPTCVFVMTSASELLGHEVLREHDQRRAENLLARLISDRGAPDEVIIPRQKVWDSVAWESFARNYQCKVRLVRKTDPKAITLLEQCEKVRSQVVSRLMESSKSLLRSPSGQREIAESLVQVSQQVQSLEKREAMLLEALKCDPACSEALLALGDLAFQKGDLKPAAEAFQKVIEIEDTRWQPDGTDWWANVATRPLMKAVFGRMLVAWHQGDLSNAVLDAEQLLQINHRDHQGVRFVMPLLYCLSDQMESAGLYFEHYERNYPGDISEPGFLFGWGLSLMGQDREQQASRKYLRGITRNLYIAPLLLDLPEPRQDIWHANDRAEPAYANEFYDSFAMLWERDPFALRSLREIYLRHEGELSRLVDLRWEMQDYQDQRYSRDHEAGWQEFLKREREILISLGVEEKNSK